MDAEELYAAECDRRRGGSDYRNCRRGALDGVRHAQPLYLTARFTSPDSLSPSAD